MKYSLSTGNLSGIFRGARFDWFDDVCKALLDWEFGFTKGLLKKGAISNLTKILDLGKRCDPIHFEAYSMKKKRKSNFI